MTFLKGLAIAIIFYEPNPLPNSIDYGFLLPSQTPYYTALAFPTSAPGVSIWSPCQ